MLGELVGASWHKDGASWLGRVGLGANRQTPPSSGGSPYPVWPVCAQKCPKARFISFTRA